MKKLRTAVLFVLCLVLVAVLTAQTGGVLRDLANSYSTRHAFITALSPSSMQADAFLAKALTDTIIIVGAGATTVATVHNWTGTTDCDSLSILGIKYLGGDSLVVYRRNTATRGDSCGLETNQPYLVQILRY